MKEIFLSVDLGGTTVKLGALDASGKVLTSHSLSSQLVQGPDQLVQVLSQECKNIQDRPELVGQRLKGLALGIPGLVQYPEGVVHQSPHFPQWKKIFLKNELENRLPFPVYMENDANKAALGEAWFGAGKNWSDFIMLTLGTGVGGGIIVDRKIFHGSMGFAGEVGHMVIDRFGPPGALGIRGTLETLTSLSGLRDRWDEIKKQTQDPEIDGLDGQSPRLPEELRELALKGNQAARKIWKDFGSALACGIGSLANCLGIFNFILGGGLAGAWDVFSESCREELPKRMYPITAKRVRIERAQLGNEAGLVGAIPMIQQG